MYVPAASHLPLRGGPGPSVSTSLNTTPNGSSTEPIRPNAESCAGIGWEPAATALPENRPAGGVIALRHRPVGSHGLQT